MNWKGLIFTIILYTQVETSLSVEISNHTLPEEVLLSRSNTHQNNLRVRDLQVPGGGERKFILNVLNLSYQTTIQYVLCPHTQ